MSVRLRAPLTTGSISRGITGLAGPMALGMLAMMIFNLVDTWFVSRLGTAALAAMSLTFPVVMVVGSIALGLGIGTTSVISRAVGSGASERVRRLTTDALLMGVAAVLLVSIAGWLTIDPLFRLLGADDVLLPLVRAYMTVWYPGAVFLVIPMLGNAAIRATGDTRTPALIMAYAGLANVAMDPVLIFGMGPFPAMGIQGAAVATVLGRATTLAGALWVLGAREKLLARRFQGLATTLRSWRSIVAVGAPAAAANLAQPLTIGLLTAMVAAYGKAAVAAFGAAGRVEMLALIPVRALASGMVPFVGQNWGARNHGRVAGGLRVGLAGGVGTGLLDYAVLAAAAVPIGRLFSADPTVVGYIALYFWIMPAAHWAMGIIGLANSALNAVGRSLSAAAVTLLRAPLLTWLFAVVGRRLAGVEGIFFGAVAASVVTGVVAWFVLAPLRLRGGGAHPTV